MPDPDIIKKSVTKDDYADSPRGGIMNILVPGWYPGLDWIAMPPDPPSYWSQERDAVLRSTVYHEAFCADAVGIASTKMVSQAWEISSEITLRAKRAQETLLNSDYVALMFRHIRDYITTDNGAFVEIVRATSAIGSRIIGVVHLDSLRITRTGDPKIPAIYRDRRGVEHEIKDYQIIMLSDMPDPGEAFNGVGFCAASRCYREIHKLTAINRYVTEKVSGRRPLAIHFINSISPTKLEEARLAAEQDASRKGQFVYMGAIVIPILDADKTPEVATVPLAEMPDGFNRKEETDFTILSYANAIGLDPQDLQPLTGQSLGAGAQSQVLDDKSKGKGLAAWKQAWTHQYNLKVLDEETTFVFVEKDYRDQERQGAVTKLRAEGMKVMTDATILTPAQALQVLVDADELPKEFLTEDMTPGDTLSDTEKPETEEALPEAEVIPVTPDVAVPPETLPVETKEAKSADALIAQEMARAVELYQGVTA